MAESHHKLSRIPFLSVSKSVSKSIGKPNFHQTSGFDVSAHGSSAYETSSRYGSFSTARKSNTSCFKHNKYSASYSTSTNKGAKGLFHQSPKTDRNKVYPSSAAASGRRSSIMGDRSRQKDNRQLSDPKYQATCTSKLLQFLMDNNYPNQISTKFLKSPSKQDVIKVFEFLFSKLDPTVEVTPIEVKVPELMTQFGYPYFITKASLISFSGRQAIGNLLGMFEFLVDNVQYLQNLDVKELISPFVVSDEAVIKNSLLRIVLDGDVDEATALDDLATKIYGTDDELATLEAEEMKLNQEIENLQKEIEYRKSVPEKTMEYQRSTEEYITYNRYMSEYITRNSEEEVQIEAEIAALESESAQLAEKLAQMNQKVNEQPYDVAQMQLSRERQRQFDKEIADDTKIIKQTKLAIHGIVNEISATKDLLIKRNDGFVADFNSSIMSINTSVIKNHVPWVIEKLQASEIQSVLDQLSSPESLAKISEVKKRFMDTINDLNKYIIGVNVDLSANSVKLLQKSQQLDLVETEKRKELEKCQENLAKAELDLQKYKQFCHEESKLLNEKFNELRKKLAEKEISVKTTINANESRISQLRNELSQQIVSNKEMTDQNEKLLSERREKEIQLLLSLEKSLTIRHESDKKNLDNLKTHVEAARLVLGRLKRKVEDSRKGSKSCCEKSQDLSKGEKTETSSVTSSHTKENTQKN